MHPRARSSDAKRTIMCRASSLASHDHYLCLLGHYFIEKILMTSTGTDAALTVRSLWLPFSRFPNDQAQKTSNFVIDPCR